MNLHPGFSAPSSTLYPTQQFTEILLPRRAEAYFLAGATWRDLVSQLDGRDPE